MTARALCAATFAALVASAGCTEVAITTHPDASIFTRDGGPDANEHPIDASFPAPVTDTCQAPGGTVGRACLTVSDCQDGCFCNGMESCTGGHCALGTGPCADTVPCTTDACLEEADRCVHVPDHGMCGDGMACNGYERCDPAHGCTSAPPLVCNDESACTLDSCDDTMGCVFTGRDLDGDGFVASTCGGDDCDDYAADVLPGAMEICDNHRDDDCDGLRDYADPTCVPTNETCAEATWVTLGPTGASVSGSTTGLRGDYTLSCGAPGADAVFRFTLTEAHDVSVAVSGGTGISVALRPFDQCAAGPDQRCVVGSPATFHQRSLAAGTWALIVRIPHAGMFDLRIDLSAPTLAPAIDRCDASTVDVGAGGTFTGRFEDTHDDYTLGCHTTSSTDVAYRFTIPAGDARDITVTGATMTGGATGPVFLALTTDCTAAASALRCETPSAASLTHRSLGPGTYYLLLEPADATATQWSMVVTFTDPPAPRNAGDACATAFDVTPAGASTTAMASVLLSSLEYDTGTSCGTAIGTRDGYFHFSLSAPHDVTVTTTTGGSHTASLATTCGSTASELRCRSGTSPLTQTFHSLPIGDYWITAQTSASSGTLTASVMLSAPTVAPPNDVCGGAISLAVPIDVRARDTLITFADDLRGGVCTPTGLVDAFYTFTLGSPMSVTLDGSTVPSGSSDVWLTLRNVCGAGADLGCGTGHGAAHVATTSPLPAGTYFVFVEMRETEASDFRLQFAAFP